MRVASYAFKLRKFESQLAYESCKGALIWLDSVQLTQRIRKLDTTYINTEPNNKIVSFFIPTCFEIIFLYSVCTHAQKNLIGFPFTKFISTFLLVVIYKPIIYDQCCIPFNDAVWQYQWSLLWAIKHSNVDILAIWWWDWAWERGSICYYTAVFTLLLFLVGSGHALTV